MKRGITILIAIFFLNCTSDDSKSIDKTGLIGTWKLIEQFADPGDGSGAFQPIESDRVIEFFSNGTLTVNSTLCFRDNTIIPNQSASGTYVFASESEFNTGDIMPNDCNSELNRITFEIEDSKLILWYLCVEGCGEKFEKIL
ncbi:hypothetical protein GCM10023311_21860 [Flaviramulus aquimarinus]|uniref:Lipocalin-like domain-containing protein n=1 Tax=Flaviramulus aquimarinus TaxID=1170456 RepID=A0ABP9FAX4_9FLAO